MAKETFEANREDVLETYNSADNQTKKAMEKLFGKEKFTSSSDWIKLWDKFCADNNLTVGLPHATPKTTDEEWDNSCVMLRHIFKVRRKDWKPDFTDGSQYKWFPVFKVTDSGFAFSGSDTVSWHSCADVGSRLCLPTEKMSDGIAREFLPIFEKFHMNL